MARTKIISIDGKGFDAYRDRGDLKSWVVYTVRDPRYGTEQWAWSPDGIGCYWYDTLADALYEHGTDEDWLAHGLTQEGYAEHVIRQEEARA